MDHLDILYPKMTNISYFVTLSLPMISGLFLLCALCKIYNSMKKQQNETQLNIKAMTLHATSFAIYMVSVVLVVVFMVQEYVYYGWRYQTVDTLMGIMQISTFQEIALVCSSISQAVLCIILWGLGEKRELE